MEKLFRVNGKIFYSEDEANAHEADLKLKKDKEETERKIAEEKQKKLLQYRETKLKEINEMLQKSKSLVDDYEKTTGNKLIYTTDLSTGNLVIKEFRNSIDYAWNNFFDDFYSAYKLK